MNMEPNSEPRICRHFFSNKKIGSQCSSNFDNVHDSSQCSSTSFCNWAPKMLNESDQGCIWGRALPLTRRKYFLSSSHCICPICLCICDYVWLYLMGIPIWLTTTIYFVFVFAYLCTICVCVMTNRHSHWLTSSISSEVHLKPPDPFLLPIDASPEANKVLLTMVGGMS